MSCLDVMYQVYGPPQPYFAAAYTPYHQKLAYYSKMQEAQECNASPSSSASGSSSFSNQTPASVKEEEDSPEKERPPEAEYINSRCVLFTYFQGDISSVVDEHFSRALSQPSSYTPSCTSSKAHRSSGPWRAEGTFPMSQRSFPASFWNSAYQAPVPAPLGSPLATAHSELPFAADPYSPAALHGHLHQGAADWHHAHPHHAHPHHPYALGGALGAQASAYPRPAVHEVYASHFDPRYGPLLMPAASGRPGRLAPASAPAPGSPPCELAAKGEPAGGGWAAPGGAFVNPAGEVAQSLGLSVDSDEGFTSPDALLHLSLPVDEVCGYHKKMADVNLQPKRDMIKKYKDSRLLPHIPASSSCLVRHLTIAPTPERHALSCELGAWKPEPEHDWQVADLGPPAQVLLQCSCWETAV